MTRKESRERAFCSKVLLFGEYNVLDYAMALSTPYSLFEGKLCFRRMPEGSVDPELAAFSKYLKHICSEDEENLLRDFDFSAFEFDVSQGLFFDSSIPRGFGVGSSGALCAAVYHRYVSAQKETTPDISRLKKTFALMESHFHGPSSGMDPLISYLEQSILVGSKERLSLADIPAYQEGEGAIFLINTGRPRQTAPLVSLFLEKMKGVEFKAAVEKSLLPITNHCIDYFLNKDCNKLYQSFRSLSQLQGEFFAPMIPRMFRSIWQKGIESNEYYLKLCGAGGGGFLLGITHNFAKVQSTLVGHQLRPLYRLSF